MARRKIQELDASSIADIAFLLLAFIIIATTLEKESGVQAFLPAKNDNPEQFEIIERNILQVTINKRDEIMVNGSIDQSPEDVKASVIEFMENPANSENLPSMTSVTKENCSLNIYNINAEIQASGTTGKLEKSLKKWKNKLKTVELVGDYRTINKFATIAIQYDKSTKYGTYLSVRDNIMSGLNKLRDDLSIKVFGVTYKHLLSIRLETFKDDPTGLEEHKAKIKAIREVYPQKIIKLEAIQK